MKQRVADYIADFLVSKGISNVFSVVGGGSMFLNDALGHHESLHCLYNHHEQACAMAAEAYYKQKGTMAAVCVTTGPGGTNTITGLLGAYQDSIPMFVISGQVRYETTVESTGLNLRQFGGQEHQIIGTISNVTKYAEMVRKPEEIRYILEKAYYEAMSGRRGPVWVDVPLGIQSAEIETEGLKGFVPNETKSISTDIECIIEELKKAERPVIVAGSAIRTVGYVDKFIKLVETLNIPVVYPLNVPDTIANTHELAMGCFGSVGNRAANFMVQNADLMLVFGCRMAFAHIGFNYKAFSPNSKKITIDIDENEQKKPTMKRDIPIIADVKDIIDGLLKASLDEIPNYASWIQYCSELKRAFPIFQEHHKTSNDGRVNPYYIAKNLLDRMGKENTIVLGNSSGLDPVLQMGIQEQGQRIILNCNCGSMGYCLPAGIGAHMASGKTIVVYTGDGCIQMNIQEMATIIHNKLPIKIVVLNNNGYGGVVATQNNFFGGRLSGCTEESGIGIPDFKKIAYAYGFDYYRIENHDEVAKNLDELLSNNRPAICEVLQDFCQGIEPSVSSRKLEDGTIVSTGIDDMAPFLSLEEYENWQYENWIKR